ncbi:MAG: threonine/homoserine/homoserine lactone efflux protein [Cyclobacteriaceae bacterium]|jgi:threonine/homoserine/homoserine lactone efflux protein
MPPYINGIFLGLIFIFSFGPGFFSLIQTSIQKGFGKAIFMVFGISLSDIFYVSIGLMGLSKLLEAPNIKFLLAIVGTCVLFIYGIFSWFKKPKIYEVDSDNKIDKNFYKYVIKGFVLSGLNPFTLVFWIGLIGFVAVKYDYTFSQKVYFFSGVLSTILVTDLLKAFLANRLRNVVTTRSILIMNRSVGLILILFAIRIIFFLFDQNGEIELPVP